MTTERVVFRLIHMPCCGQLLCWVNPRLPNYCPECGQHVMHKLQSSILVTDQDAELKLEVSIGPLPIR